MDEKGARGILRHRMTICLSGKCNRGCRHCIASATMDSGKFFTLKHVEILAKEAGRFAKEVEETYRAIVEFDFCFTGDGEFMLNPWYPQIFDILFNFYPAVEIGVVTSGVDPKSPEEENRLLEILSKPYADRIDWCLSFNLFQSRFPKRLIRTLKLLFENGADKAVIKVVQSPQHVYRTINRLDAILERYFIKWVRELSPLASHEEAFPPMDLSTHAKKMAEELYEENPNLGPEDNLKALDLALRNVRIPSEWEVGEWYVHLNVHFPQTFSFDTKFGQKRITYEPQHLVKQGRAANIKNIKWLFPDHLRLCAYLRSGEGYAPIHVGSDGYYYPSCDCPKAEVMRIGHIEDNMFSAWKSFLVLRDGLLMCMIKSNRRYGDICEHCIHVMQGLKDQGLLKEIGIN